VSDDQSASNAETMIEALDVKRNAAVGLAVGVGVAALAYVVRILELLGPVATNREYPVLGEAGWFLMLAVVFAVSTALLVVLVLTGVRMAQLVNETRESEQG